MRRAGRIWALLAPLALLLALTACAQMDEAGARAILARWFVPGEALYFRSTRDCTAGLFRLRSGEVKPRLVPEERVSAALAALERGKVLALAHPQGTPDEAFVEVMNQSRPVGVALQEAAFSARECMDEEAQGLYRRLWTTPGAVLVFDRAAGLVAVMDPEARMAALATGVVQ